MDTYFNNFSKTNQGLLNWDVLNSAHERKSSDIFLDTSGQLIKKVNNKREYSRLENECNNLQRFNQLFENSSFYFPTPFYHNGIEMIMGYVPGVELDRLLSSETIPEQNLDVVLTQIGDFMRLKEGYGIIHNDFKPRHLMVNTTIVCIDVEMSCIDSPNKSRAENYQMISSLNRFLGKEKLKLTGYVK